MRRIARRNGGQSPEAKASPICDSPTRARKARVPVVALAVRSNFPPLRGVPGWERELLLAHMRTLLPAVLREASKEADEDDED